MLVSLALGLAILIMPSEVLSSDVVGMATKLVENFNSKLTQDLKIVSLAGPLAEVRYVVSYIVSLGLCAAGCLWALFAPKSLNLDARSRPSYVSLSNVYIMPTLLLIIIYLAFFDTFLAEPGSRISKGILETRIRVFWPPLLFSTLLVGFQRTILVLRYYKNGLIS